MAKPTESRFNKLSAAIEPQPVDYGAITAVRTSRH
jgi:hypothetical protein